MADSSVEYPESIHAFGQLSYSFEAVDANLPPMTNMPGTEGPDDVYCGGCG